MLGKVVAKALAVEDEFATTAYSQCVATMINKAPDEGGFTSACEGVLGSLAEALQPGSPRQPAVACLSWVCKALVMRGHSLMAKASQMLLRLLADVGVSEVSLLSPLPPTLASGRRGLLPFASSSVRVVRPLPCAPDYESPLRPWPCFAVRMLGLTKQPPADATAGGG